MSVLFVFFCGDDYFIACDNALWPLFSSCLGLASCLGSGPRGSVRFRFWDGLVGTCVWLGFFFVRGFFLPALSCVISE